MTHIQSSTELNVSIEQAYNFLNDMNNHQQLMPENIYNWSSTQDEASFTIQNMAKLAIKIDARIPHTEITAIPTEKPPFDLALKWSLEAKTPEVTIATHTISADLNMMMKMIASGPLQKLADFQTKKLKEVLG